MTNTYILGLNSIGFNTAAAMIKNGAVEGAVEEERLTREKRTRRFPDKGVRWLLKQANLQLEDISAIATAWNPLVNLEAHNASQSGTARYLGEMLYSVPSHLLAISGKKSGFYAEQNLTLSSGKIIKTYYLLHHLAHASSFFLSPFETAAVLVVDAFGEKDCVSFWEGRGTSLSQRFSQAFPHSLGAFYSTMTEYLGFAPQNDEWKVMGAAAFSDGKKFYPKLKQLFRLDNSGAFELDLSYFNFYQFHRPLRYSTKLISHLGIEPNRLEEPLTDEYYDLAAASQRVFEDIYFHLMNGLYEKVKTPNLVLAGGCALNCLANGKIAQKTPFTSVFIPPVPDDSGGSLGAAYYVYHAIQGNRERHPLHHNYLGPDFSEKDIRAALDSYKIAYKRIEDPAKTGAALIYEGKIIGWFQGRTEFGDRALGHRSILADPRRPEMKDKVNSCVKYREHFRPFAPSVMEESFDEIFENARQTPFMENAFVVKEYFKSRIPAVVHEDGTARLQTVSSKREPLYWNLIDKFRELSGVPVILNTSFNVKGEPIVCSPSDAIRTFYSSGLDALVMGNFLLEKDT